jgi:Tfp pilus assembly protein PilO
MKTNSSIALLIVAVGLFYTFTNPQYQQVKELRAIAAEYKEVLANVSNIVALRDNLILTYNALPKEEIERVTKLLPDDVDTVRLALDLDSLASTHNTTIESFRTSLDSEDGGSFDDEGVILPENEPIYEIATVSFSFISTYEDFVLLMGDLEKNLRITDVKSVTFTANEDNSSLYNFSVSVEIYWLK